MMCNSLLLYATGIHTFKMIPLSRLVLLPPNREQCGVRMLMMKTHAATISILDGCSVSQVIDMVMLTMLNDSGRVVSNKAGKRGHANPEDGFLAALSRSKVMPSHLQTP